MHKRVHHYDAIRVYPFTEFISDKHESIYISTTFSTECTRDKLKTYACISVSEVVQDSDKSDNAIYRHEEPLEAIYAYNAASSVHQKIYITTSVNLMNARVIYSGVVVHLFGQ